MESDPKSFNKLLPLRFMSWRDLVVSPLVLISLLCLAAVLTWIFAANKGLSWLELGLIFYLIVIGVSIILVRILLIIWPIREGVYFFDQHAVHCYRWTLVSLITITILAPIYYHGFIPPPLRKWFLWLLGASVPRGVLSMGGVVSEPYLLTIEEGALLGHDSLLLSHAIAAIGRDVLILGRIKICRRAVVGARCVVMPGVTVGENSMVNAMSYVPTNTKIPPNEIWGGVPAKKIGKIEPR